jgi:signal transduction histidine kinase
MLLNFFSNDGFMPHIHCYLDRPSLVWAMVTTDTLIGVAYVVISATLYTLVRKIKLPYHSVFLAFGLFILACGTTHFMEVYNLWVPNYWLSAFIKLITASASIATAIYLLRLFPQIIDVAAATKDILRTKTSVEEYFRRKISTPPELRRLIIRAVLVPFAFAFAFILISALQASYLGKVRSWVERSDEIMRQGHLLEEFATDAQNDLRGFWFSGFRDFISSSQKSERKFGRTHESLRQLVADNEEQTAQLEKIADVFDKWRGFARQRLKSIPTPEQRHEGMAAFMRRHHQFTSAIHEASERFMEDESEIRARHANKTQTVSLVSLGATSFLTVLLAVFFALFGRRELVRISRSFSAALQAEKETQEKLRKAVSTRDEFLSIASHELKTPLTSLKLQIQMTKRWLDRDARLPAALDKLNRTVDVSNTQVSRLQRLIDDLLDVSRVGAGKLQYQFEDTDLRALIEDTVERFNEVRAPSNPRIIFTSEDRFPARCDRFRIEQVVTNLLSNAVKYGANKQITVSLEGKDDLARFLVCDNGIGIAKENQDKIFERFERVSGLNRSITGLGLGLFISREIVHAHNGTIRVESEPGLGSVFTVEFPRQSLTA